MSPKIYKTGVSPMATSSPGPKIKRHPEHERKDKRARRRIRFLRTFAVATEQAHRLVARRLGVRRLDLKDGWLDHIAAPGVGYGEGPR